MLLVGVIVSTNFGLLNGDVAIIFGNCFFPDVIQSVGIGGQFVLIAAVSVFRQLIFIGLRRKGASYEYQTNFGNVPSST